MKCSVCGNEMEKGKTSFLSMQGFGQMMLSFSSEEEARKGIFNRKSHDNMIMSGTETEAYYCSVCKSIVTIIKE